jgi:hypothetical protein
MKINGKESLLFGYRNGLRLQAKNTVITCYYTTFGSLHVWRHLIYGLFTSSLVNP